MSLRHFCPVAEFSRKEFTPFLESGIRVIASQKLSSVAAQLLVQHTGIRSAARFPPSTGVLGSRAFFNFGVEATPATNRHGTLKGRCGTRSVLQCSIEREQDLKFEFRSSGSGQLVHPNPQQQAQKQCEGLRVYDWGSGFTACPETLNPVQQQKD